MCVGGGEKTNSSLLFRKAWDMPCYLGPCHHIMAHPPDVEGGSKCIK
jgi:hypothetical protein